MPQLSVFLLCSHLCPGASEVCSGSLSPSASSHARGEADYPLIGAKVRSEVLSVEFREEAGTENGGGRGAVDEKHSDASLDREGFSLHDPIPCHIPTF